MQGRGKYEDMKKKDIRYLERSVRMV